MYKGAALQRCDLGDELPHLAGTCLSIYVRSYIVCQIKPKLLQMRSLRLCGGPAIMPLVIHFW